MMLILKLLFILDLWLVSNVSNARHVKKERSKELMLVAWHPTRWWDWCMSEDEKEKKK